MKKYDIALYGNLTMDELTDKNGHVSYRLGGIANIERHLKKRNPALEIAMVPLWFSSYEIDAHGDIQCYTLGYTIPQRRVRAAWNHFSYADECRKPMGVKLHSQEWQKGHLIAIPGYNIIHSPSGSNLFTHPHEELVKQTTFVPIPNLVSIGAGDMLVAEIILAVMDGKNIRKVIEKCHRNVTTRIAINEGL